MNYFLTRQTDNVKVRTEPEGLQSGSVKHYEASLHKELLVGLIHDIVWFIDPSKLDTRRLLEAEQIRHLRAESVIVDVLQRKAL